MEFLKFGGTNSQLWRDRCELYFEVYAMVKIMKMCFTALNFTGPVVVWLQTVERCGCFHDREAMVEAMIAYFDKDQY
jgi:hypothetical protein